MSSVERAAPLHLKVDGDDGGNNNQPITNNNGDDLLLKTTVFLGASTFASICTLWSEYSVLHTGCGPKSLSDALERGSYLGVLVVAGLSVFVRIVSEGQSLSNVYKNIASKSGMSDDNNVYLYVNLVISCCWGVRGFVDAIHQRRADGWHVRYQRCQVPSNNTTKFGRIV